MSTSRRGFLALIGLGGAAVATPAAATIIANKLQGETKNPCLEIDTAGTAIQGHHRLKIEPTQVPTPKSLEELIDRAARYQVKAENGDFFSEHCPDKEAHARAWADAAAAEMHKVETFAHDMGLITIWPGYYPEFYKRTGLTAKHGLLYVNGTHVSAVEADRIAHAMGHPNAESLVKALS